ncbi:LysR family transcriptional regulator [Phreatobacter oligotrophus]|uniref:LysR family transcriptional regulator n=1 Tax=Phreatobacter oligotrophus TaxID=1122261 RepID=A0A2T4ZI87_9HYPH|nr:LysR family transcriptional regulator [Phreatobacter oligotrophus]PTM61692.1 LysR family transcriptional regulator [Phreatobacter oligotrophus]
MADFSNTELRRLDLTLLLVFLGLLRLRKAAGVAAELGLTQSAVSQALRRLRAIFGDDLFLRRPHGMEPTAVALALEPAVRGAVEALRGALGSARAFDPAAATGIVRIAALDAAQSVVVPPLARRMALDAPGLRLSVLPLARGEAVAALAEGRADLSIGFIWDRPDMVSAELLYEEGYRVAGRPEALPDAPHVSLDAYCAADHVLISPGGDMRGVIDDHLEALGRSRRVMLALPAFLPALAAVAASGALVTLPARVAEAFAGGFGLVTAAPPVEVRRFPVSVFWHRRNDADARTLWLRRQLAAAVAGA